jgi:peptide/nickel transport system ATP-binding protein
MPRLDRDRSERLLPIAGTPPSLINVPSGCPFHPRCVFEENTHGLAREERPDLTDNGAGRRHMVACHMSPGQRQQIWRDDIRPRL